VDQIPGYRQQTKPQSEYTESKSRTTPHLGPPRPADAFRPTRILQGRRKTSKIRWNQAPERRTECRTQRRRRSRNGERNRRWGKREAGGYTAHVGELAEGVGVHLGAQPQQGADNRRRRRHLAPCSPLRPGWTGGVVAEWTARLGRLRERSALAYLLDFHGLLLGREERLVRHVCGLYL
jgi:hypothetical protein